MSVSIGLPHLFGNELSLMENVFRRGFRRYLEFGLGGSTLLALRSNPEVVVAVDSDPQWVSAVKTHSEFAERISDGTASILHANIGAVREWGHPRDETSLKAWPNYIAIVWREWAIRRCLPDLIYIDGRFRVACAYSIAVIFGGLPSRNRPTVLFHDFNDERPHYRDVLRYFDIEERIESLLVLRRKTEASAVAALDDLLLRQFDPG